MRAGARRRPWRPGQRRQVGPRRDRARGPLARPRHDERRRRSPDPARVLTMVARLLREGDAREGAAGGDLRPEDARCLLGAWLAAVGLASSTSAADRVHAGRALQPRRALPARLPRCTSASCATPSSSRCAAASGEADVGRAAAGLSTAASPAIPYAPRRRSWPTRSARSWTAPRRAGETPRVAILADGIGSTHGVTRTIEEIRQRGVRASRSRSSAPTRRSTAACRPSPRSRCPSTRACRSACRACPAAVQTLADGALRRDPCLLARPGRARRRAVARALGLPLIGSYHTELTAYAGLRSGQPQLEPCDGAGVERLLRRLRPGALAQPGLRCGARRASGRPRSGRALGPRRRHLAASTPRCASRGAAARTTHQRALRRADHAREGRRPARRGVPGGPRARAAPAPGARRRRPRAGAPARARSASTRRSSAGSRARSWRALTRAPTCSCSPARPTPSAR